MRRQQKKNRDLYDNTTAAEGHITAKKIWINVEIESIYRENPYLWRQKVKSHSHDTHTEKKHNEKKSLNRVGIMWKSMDAVKLFPHLPTLFKIHFKAKTSINNVRAYHSMCSKRNCIQLVFAFLSLSLSACKFLHLYVCVCVQK